MRHAWAWTANAIATIPTHAPNAAPDMIHAGAVPGIRCAASSPPIAPTSAAPPDTARRRWRNGRPKHRPPRDRRHEQVAGICGLDRQRPAVGAAPESDRQADRDDGTQVGGPVLQHAMHADVVERGVADVAAQDQHGAAAEEGRQVHVVGDIEPLGVAQASDAPGAAQVGER